LRRRRIARLCALGVATVLVAACGVLTIDVDVYKGPLVNDDAVQIEQVAAITGGAKPLLIQLRDRLEAQHRYGDVANGVRQLRIALGPRHRFDFIESGESDFTDDRALQVNGVLSLYKDQGGVRLGKYLADLAKATDDYEIAYRAFTRTAEDDASFLARIEPAFAVGKPGRGRLADDCKLAGHEATLDELRQALRKGYEEFHAPGKSRRSVGALDIVRAHHCLLRKRPLVSELVRRTWPNVTVVQIPDPTVAGRLLSEQGDRELKTLLVSQEASYAVLATAGIAQFHALLLFAPAAATVPPSGAGAAEAFVQRTREIAGAWLPARDALERAWRASLDLLAAASTSSTATREELSRIRKLARLASELVEPHLLVAVLRTPQSPAGLDSFKASVLPVLARRNSAVLLAEHRSFVRVELERAIVANPAGTAAALATADRVARTYDFGPAEIDAHSIDGRFAPAIARKHGLARAPDPEVGEVITAAEVRELTSAVLEGTGGFGGGRLPLGLESLVSAYRQASHLGTVGETRRQLLDELVIFAQKVLFVANFSLLVDQNEIRQDSFLLQATGNAILTQVDELKHADTAGRRAARRAVADEEIRRKIWEPLQKRTTAPAVIECDRSQLANASDPDAPKRVLDCIITELRYLLLASLKEGGAGTTTAANLEGALREALEQRSRFVQLRPAAAFLRNSYPVTSLQRESSTSWSNLLEAHAARQLNYTGVAGPAARVIQDFDKQFWQNVNTVRVAGAGITNYVLAKDDVGNWYVKNFASDPEVIIKGAKSLALFAAGGTLSADAVNRASEKIRNPDSVRPSGEAGDGGAARLLQDQRAAAEQKDKAQTDALVADIKTVRSASGLAPRLDRAWKAGGTADADRRELLAVAIETAEPSCQAAAAPAAAEERTLAELRALIACRDALIVNLQLNLLNANLGPRFSAVTGPGTRASSKRTDGAALIPTTEMTAATSRTDSAVSSLDTASTEAANIVARAADPPNALVAANAAKAALGTAASELGIAQVALTTARTKSRDAVVRFNEAGAEADAADAAAKKGRVMTSLSAAAVVAIGKVKVAAGAFADSVPAADRVADAVVALNTAVSDMDAVAVAYGATTPPANAATLATKANESVATALARVRALRDAVRATNVAGVKQAADEAKPAVDAIAKAPAAVTAAEAQSARSDVHKALTELLIQLSTRRDEILRDHTARLKAILGE
jgi:hypothetical protein